MFNNDKKLIEALAQTSKDLQEIHGALVVMNQMYALDRVHDLSQPPETRAAFAKILEDMNSVD